MRLNTVIYQSVQLIFLEIAPEAEGTDHRFQHVPVSESGQESTHAVRMPPESHQEASATVRIDGNFCHFE
jgi:hypothetical protein